jgi:phenylacetate-CoA ligase
MQLSASTALCADQNPMAEVRQVLSCGRRIEDYQVQKLKQLWERARSAPAYAGLGPYSYEAFLNLPVIPKARLKQHPRDSEGREAARAIKYYESSGTGGTPTPTRRTAEDLLWNYSAVAVRWGEIINHEDRCAILLPSDIAPIGDMMAGVAELTGACVARCFPFTQGIVTWNRIEALCSRFQPTVLFASPGTLIQMMLVFKNRGTFRSCAASVTRIMLAGEVVCKALQRMLGREWGAEVHIASYGSTETGTIAATGADKTVRLLEYAAICEIDTPKGPKRAEPGDSGRLVVTPLNAYARPLLRFDTGDQVRILATPDGLGKSIEILGRDEERIVIGNRSLLTEEIEELVYGIEGLTGYLFRQSGESLSIVLELDPEWPDRSEETTARARSSLRDAGISIPVMTVAQLPVTTKSGGSLKNWKRSNFAQV